MKPRPHTTARARAETVLFIITLLLAAALALSCFLHASHTIRALDFTLATGGLEISHDDRVPLLSSVPTINRLFLTSAARIRSHWLPQWSGAGSVWRINIPLWIPLILTAASAIYLHRRRPAPGACPRCNYDLRGLVTPLGASPRCPECGTLFPADPGPRS